MKNLLPISHWMGKKCFIEIRNKTRVDVFITLTEHSTGSPSHRDQTRRKIKGIQIGKEEVKLSLFADDIIVYTENSIDFNKKLLDLIIEFGKIVGYKVNILNQMHFCTPTMKYQKQKSGENPILCRNKENKVPRNKPNQGGKRPVLRQL